MTCILLCHFLLDIRSRNKHPDLGHTSIHPTISISQTAVWHFDVVVMNGFGETATGSSALNEGDQEEIDLQENYMQNRNLMVGTVEKA